MFGGIFKVFPRALGTIAEAIHKAFEKYKRNFMSIESYQMLISIRLVLRV